MKVLLARIRRYILLLKVARRHPSQKNDQRIFDRAWSDGGRLARDSPEFLDGQQPHQRILAKAIKDEHELSGRVLTALAGRRQTTL